jgi:hypothetical protein
MPLPELPGNGQLQRGQVPSTATDGAPTVPPVDTKRDADTGEISDAEIWRYLTSQSARASVLSDPAKDTVTSVDAAVEDYMKSLDALAATTGARKPSEDNSYPGSSRMGWLFRR